MSQTTKQFKKQLPKNALMSTLSFATYSISAIWLTPYLVNHLGEAAYGLIPIAGLLTQYVSVITSNLAGSVNRFLTIEIQKPHGKPNAIFNSSLALYVLLILIQLPLFAIGIIYADILFSIPPELKIDALLLLGCSAGGFLVSLLNGVFSVSLYSQNRLDISSAMNLGRLALRLCLVILIFSILSPKLRYIGYIDLGLHVLMLSGSVFFWAKLTPELSVSARHIDMKILKPVFKMSIWTFINQVGGLLYVRTDLWIINRFISPIAAGQYAAMLVISNFIRQLGFLISSQFGPIIMKYWAKGESDELRRLLLLAMRIMAIAIAIPVALICINSKHILGLWLGPNYVELSSILILLCIHLPINVAIAPLMRLQIAGNAVMLPSIVTLLTGSANVIMSYYLGVKLAMGPIGVALATAIVLTLKNALFTPLYGAHILNVPSHACLKPLSSGILMLGIVWFISFIPFYSAFHLDDQSIWTLLIQCAGTGACSIFIGFFFLISRKDRRLLINILPANAQAIITRMHTKHA